MAALAFRAKAPLVTGLLVVALVASDAGRRELLLVQDPRVTRVARRELVLSFQGIPGVAIVVEGRRLPGLVGVTGSTISSELALVSFLLVVLLMARDARERRAFEVLRLVTRIAGHV